MAAPKTYPDELKALVHQLINEDGRKATQLAPILRNHGYEQIPPLDTIRAWARETRGNITDKPKADQLRSLTALAVQVIHDGFSRIQAKPQDSDADETLKLVRSLRELEPLLTDKPQEKDTDGPKGTLGGLSSVPEPSEDATSLNAQTSRSLSA